MKLYILDILIFFIYFINRNMKNGGINNTIIYGIF